MTTEAVIIWTVWGAHCYTATRHVELSAGWGGVQCDGLPIPRQKGHFDQLSHCQHFKEDTPPLNQSAV